MYSAPKMKTSSRRMGWGEGAGAGAVYYIMFLFAPHQTILYQLALYSVALSPSNVASIDLKFGPSASPPFNYSAHTNDWTTLLCIHHSCGVTIS